MYGSEKQEPSYLLFTEKQREQAGFVQPAGLLARVTLG